VDEDKISQDKLADLWINYSQQMWGAIYATPTIAAGVFAGWYIIKDKGSWFLPVMVLALGCVLMLMQFLVVRRMGQYGKAMKKAMGTNFPYVDKPRFGITGTLIAQIIPMIIMLTYVFLMIEALPFINF
jgi:hypothetical protein